jgi:hypothetical protein
MTSLLVSAKSITSELLTLRAKHVSRWLGEVGGSHQIVIRWQCRPPASRQANALEQIITKIDQDGIGKIHADWASMETDRVVSNDNSQKGSSWIWSKADFWNLRFGLSCLSAVQRLVDCTRFCKMVLTRFTPVVHRVFLLMHFMITTWTRSRQIRSLGRSRTVSLALIGARSNIFWIWNSRSQIYIRDTRTRSNLPMTAIMSCRIHVGFSTSTCFFLAFA